MRERTDKKIFLLRSRKLVNLLMREMLSAMTENCKKIPPVLIGVCAAAVWLDNFQTSAPLAFPLQGHLCAFGTPKKCSFKDKKFCAKSV